LKKNGSVFGECFSSDILSKLEWKVWGKLGVVEENLDGQLLVGVRELSGRTRFSSSALI
jgi:hypothetical protein